VPSIAENIEVWEGSYDWPVAGEEWSAAWGGSKGQWLGAILPRVARFLPAGTMLEIAPGFGRWTQYLRDQCERLIIVDLSERCIRACQERFAGDSHIVYHVNDGTSLEMIESGTIDFVFSLDSLVHVEADVIEKYVGEFARVLSARGAGFIHHSNAGAYRRYFELQDRLPAHVRARLQKARAIEWSHWRAMSMSASRFEAFCDAAGLRCIAQEQVNWGTRRLIDCLSTFAPASSPWARPNRVVRNPGFMDEAKAISRWGKLYLDEPTA
jgi:ubiquinone/menaquinone biosynthesis C-methylase UbiE